MSVAYFKDDATRLDWKEIGSVANTDGFILKAGSSYATAISVGAVAGKFMNFYLKSTATTGAIQGMYLRTYAAGAGSGVTLNSGRIFATVYDVAIGTAVGAHISLNFNASGSITGLGTGSRSTLHVPDVVMANGTYAGGMSEVWFDGTTSRIAGTTKHSIHRFVVDGAAGYTNDMTTVFEFVGLGSGQFVTNTAGASEKVITTYVNGVKYGIMCVAL